MHRFPAPASFWMGDSKRGNEFYRVARHHLAYLFDCSNYKVAEALVGMCILAFGQVDSNANRILFCTECPHHNT